MKTDTQRTFTKAQERAIASVKQYLSSSPFSRRGLIEQLQSSGW